jgi:hypothetical protein
MCFHFYIFVYLREGEKNPTKKNPKKEKKNKYVRLSVRPSGRTGSATEKVEAGSATQNAPRNV